MKNKVFKSLIIIFSVLILYPTFTLVEARHPDHELSDRAKPRDTNGDGMLQRDEAGGKALSNFDTIDCDKNGGLSGYEIQNFFSGKGCPEKVAGSLPFGQKIDISGNQEEYSAALMLPEGTGPFPAVVISHGAGGAGIGYYDHWGKNVVKWGFAAIVMDHYRPRGYPPGRGNKRASTKESFDWRRDDLISLLKMIKKDDRLDNSRVTLGGWSRGAGFVMHGISDPEVRKEAEFDAPIKSAILYYPQSTTIFRNFEGKIDVPTIFITGDKDFIWWAPTHGWKNKLDEYRSPDHPFILKVYKGAYHAFDNPVYSSKRCRTLGEGEHCMLYDEAAHKQSTGEIKAFLMKYAK